MKTCSCCHIKKKNSDFRKRVDKRRIPHFVYLNSSCKKCDTEKAMAYHNSLKDDPEYLEKNRKRAREYGKKHAKKISDKMKIVRQSNEYKKMVREYRENNKDKIYEQEVVTKNRYHEKHRDAVTDVYVVGKLVQQGLTKEVVKEYPEIIELHRIKLITKRKLNKHDYFSN